MVQRVLEALRPQVGPVLISANRQLERYAAFGHPVVPDTLPDHPGPLAGVLAALRRLETGFAAIVPCDAPLLPPDLVARLFAACQRSHADGAVVHTGGRREPAFVLLRATVAPSLEDFLAGGQRGMGAWLERLTIADASFAEAAAAFVNVNDRDELRRVEALLNSSTGAR
jgi:molybdopterin-guanine dinucleotide biosynthesis protein A